MRVLVTGASGFVGHAACRELLRRGHEVRALVRRPGSEPAGATPVAGDLTDGRALNAALREAAPQGVVHLAAEIASQRSARAACARSTCDGHCAGCWRPCRAARRRAEGRVRLDGGDRRGQRRAADRGRARCRCRRRTGAPSRRASALAARTPACRRSCVRPGTSTGPAGWYEHEIVARLRQPGRFAVVGRGDNLWDVVHVDDVAGAFVDRARAAPPRARSTTWPTTSRSPTTTSWRSARRRARRGPPAADPGLASHAWRPGSNAVTAVVRRRAHLQRQASSASSAGRRATRRRARACRRRWRRCVRRPERPTPRRRAAVRTEGVGALG